MKHIGKQAPDLDGACFLCGEGKKMIFFALTVDMAGARGIIEKTKEKRCPGAALRRNIP